MTTATAPGFEVVAKQISDLDAQIAVLKEQREQLAAFVLATVQPGEKVQAGDYEVMVRKPAKRLDATKLAAAFPSTARPELYKLVIDMALVRKNVAPIELEGADVYGTPGTPSVVVK